MLSPAGGWQKAVGSWIKCPGPGPDFAGSFRLRHGFAGQVAGQDAGQVESYETGLSVRNLDSQRRGLFTEQAEGKRHKSEQTRILSGEDAGKKAAKGNKGLSRGGAEIGEGSDRVVQRNWINLVEAGWTPRGGDLGHKRSGHKGQAP